MPAPTEKSNVDEFIDYNLFIHSRLAPDAAVKAMQPLIVVPHDVLMAAIGGRNLAHNNVLFAQGHLAYCREQIIGDPLTALALKIAAHYGDAKAAGYVRLFTYTPAVLTAAPLRDQPTMLAQLATALGEAETPAEVKKLATGWLADHAAYAAALKNVEAMQKLLGKADDAIAAAKAGCLIGYARLRGQLQDKFPRKARLVASYFPPAPRKKTVKKPEG